MRRYILDPVGLTVESEVGGGIESPYQERIDVVEYAPYQPCHEDVLRKGEIPADQWPGKGEGGVPMGCEP